MQYFGTKIVKFIELIIERRYQEFESNGALTVIATNLQPADLEKTYDERTVSRLAAMTEIVPFCNDEEGE
jgi:DNA replication protein DnaC